jgi:hypothetical protein
MKEFIDKTRLTSGNRVSDGEAAPLIAILKGWGSAMPKDFPPRVDFAASARYRPTL